jgi:ATP-binding cassette, subfamily F, member 3
VHFHAFTFVSTVSQTTQLRILAGEIEPTTGEIVKSSRNLRMAFLRQEFIDELVPTRTLRDELYSAFEEERQLLRDIADCEEEVGRTTDDPAKMEEVLNRLQKLQDQAISKGVYALDSKVEKVMDSTGFSTSDADALVKSFSGGWKMRIGLAKILLKDP